MKERLSEEFLNTWRRITRDIWIAENNPSEVDETEMRNRWAERVNFLAGLYIEYNLDEDKEIYVSEITGNIYYEE